jgi:hypothetical protein
MKAICCVVMTLAGSGALRCEVISAGIRIQQGQHKTFSAPSNHSTRGVFLLAKDKRRHAPLCLHTLRCSSERARLW